MARFAGALTAFALLAAAASTDASASEARRPLCRVEIVPVEGLPAQGTLLGFKDGVFTIGTRLGEFEISERDIARIAFIPMRQEEARTQTPVDTLRLTAREQADIRSQLMRLRSRGRLDEHIQSLEADVRSSSELAAAARTLIELGMAHRLAGDAPDQQYWTRLVESIEDARLRREVRATLWQLVRMMDPQARGRRQP